MDRALYFNSLFLIGSHVVVPQVPWSHQPCCHGSRYHAVSEDNTFPDQSKNVCIGSGQGKGGERGVLEPA